MSELLSRGADDLRAGLKDTDDEVSAMLAEWRGDSGGAYENAWRLWHQGADIDDIVTTGATAAESVRVLQTTGGRVVGVLTVAHA